MQYRIHLGIPEMLEFWQTLERKHNDGTASKKEERVRKQLGKTMYLLSQNPPHPGLHSHEITALTARYGMKVREPYLENNTPGAGRVFWVYGPEQGDITIIGLEPHPNDKSNSYNKIVPSSMGEPV